MRLVPLVAVVLLGPGSCGGRTGLGELGVACAESNASSDGGSLPAVGSAACNNSGTDCVLCNDDQWHCQGLGVFAQCPADIEQGSSCSAVSQICFSCSGGMGVEYQCRHSP